LVVTVGGKIASGAKAKSVQLQCLEKSLKCYLSEFQHAFDDENYQNETDLVTLARYLLNVVDQGTM
jgi:hypothetical protein